MLSAVLCLIAAFLMTVLLMPFVIALSRKLKVRQTVLHYVDNHLSKSGTPTMGGIAFILSAAVIPFMFMSGTKSLAVLVVLVMVGYGIIGFLDDFIKVFFKQNKGLSALQKLAFQVIISIIVSLYAYNNQFIGDILYIPFTFGELKIGIFAIPLFIIVFLAFTNSVNLTDGLDGLAASVTAIYTAANLVLIALAVYFFGDGQAFVAEYNNIVVLCAGLVGSLIGFICYNGFPAKIFMGDTGALSLGGAMAALAVVSRMSFYVPIIGIMYVLTSLSVIIQVLYFKRTKKRIFLMAPLHHHFERKGVHENRIVTVYSAITMAIGVLCIAITMFINS